MENIYCYLTIIVTILRINEAAPSQIKQSDITENDINKISKLLKNIQESLHDSIPHDHDDNALTSENNNEDANGLTSDNELATTENNNSEDPSKLFFMLVIGKKPNVTCDDNHENDNYSIESYNHELMCKCRFCENNVRDQNYESQCQKSICEVSNEKDPEESDFNSENEDNDTDVLQDTLNSIKDALGQAIKPDCKHNCERPDLDDMNKLLCKGNECHFKFI